MTSVVEAQGLGRRFGARVAVHDVELAIRAGSILGLAGPNGSGKTTLLKLLAGLLRPTAGEVRVFGIDPWSRREAVMRRARFAFAPPALHEAFSAREHVLHIGGLGGARPTSRAIDRALELVGLSDRARDRVGTFSFGMRQRLALAMTLVPEPELLVLDEPADGLDPLAVLDLRATLARLCEDGSVTILLSSHLLLELDQLVDELLVLDEGETLFQGPPRALRGERGVVHVRVDDLERAGAALTDAAIDHSVRADQIELTSRQAPSLDDLRTLFAAHDLVLQEYAEHRPSLEQALLDRLRARRSGGAE